ncbi:MAG: TonB-dependent receptor, partial [Nevskiales bacterium]
MLLALPALATAESDTSTSKGHKALDTVVVTGEKLGRSLQDTASSVSITTEAELEDYGDEGLEDVAERTANVTTSGQGELSIRGVSATGAEGLGGGSPVISTYLDGVPVDNFGVASNVFDSFDMEQIEILRGPQSTSLGRNVLAGAVVAVSRDPTAYWDARTRIRAADLGTRQYAFAGGGPLSENLAFRLTANYRETDGFLTNTTLNDDRWGAEEQKLLRGKLAWSPELLPGLDLLLTGARTGRDGRRSLNIEQNSDGDSARRTATNNEDPSPNYAESDLWSLRASYPLNEYTTLTATSGYIDTRWEERLDYDQSDYDGGVGYFDQHNRNYSQEIRLNIKDWGRWTGVVGIYAGRFLSEALYANNGVRISGSEILPVPLVGDLVEISIDQYNDFSDEADNLALFTEFDYAATERLTLTLGLRYDTEERAAINDYAISRADGYLVPGGPLTELEILGQLFTSLGTVDLIPLLGAGLTPNPSTNGAQTAEAEYDALLPKLGLRYQLTDIWTAVATYAEAYRAGGAEVNSSDATINEFEPEFTKNYEVGLRAYWPEQNIRFSLNAYSVDWEDQQVQVPTTDGINFITQNAANSTLYGGELEASWQLNRAWNLYLSYGYSRTEFEEYRTASDDYSGNAFVQAPENSGSIGA